LSDLPHQVAEPAEAPVKEVDKVKRPTRKGGKRPIRTFREWNGFED
jgi:hypothetical protein